MALFISILAGFGIGGAIAAFVAWSLLKNYVPSYLAEKGKNLATREDVEEITEKIESIKSSYTMLSEQFKAQHQLRMAAVERRLQAHQEAFALWRDLVQHTYSPSIAETVSKCQTWWDNNCLYLDAGARDAFSKAFFTCNWHAQAVDQGASTAVIMENWATIMAAGDEIAKAVALPGLTSAEKDELKSEAVARAA